LYGAHKTAAATQDQPVTTAEAATAGQNIMMLYVGLSFIVILSFYAR